MKKKKIIIDLLNYIMYRQECKNKGMEDYDILDFYKAYYKLDDMQDINYEEFDEYLYVLFPQLDTFTDKQVEEFGEWVLAENLYDIDSLSKCYIEYFKLDKYK